MQLINIKECEEFLRDNCWEHGSIRKKERAYALYFNRLGKRVFYEEIGAGGYKGVTIDLRGAMKCAFDINSDYVIIAHNHPSGDISPSNEDIIIAERVKLAFSFFDIFLVDFMILTHEDCFSFKENGLLELKKAG